MKILLNQRQFPIGAESDSFTAAMASALIIALGYKADTPYWCAPNGRYCTHCAPCGDDWLSRHQESVYHCLLTAFGFAFGFEYPWDDTASHSLPDIRDGWRWDDDYIDFIMRFAGVTWKRLSRTDGKEKILSAILEAIDCGFPTLVRFGKPLDWQLITGYDGNMLLGLDSFGHTLKSFDVQYRADDLFAMEKWYDTAIDVIVLSGRCERKITYREILEKIESALSYCGHDAVEQMIEAALDHVTRESAMDTAHMIANINSVLIEARYHAAEAFVSPYNLLNNLCENQALWHRLSDLLFQKYIADDHDETHGIGWKIWEAIGVSPQTGYLPTQASVDMILKAETRIILKQLFHTVFENDRAVLKGIQNLLYDSD